MLRTVPFLIAAIAIIALTYVEGSITDRWVDGNLPSAYCSSLLDGVPSTIGDWEGTDAEVDPKIQRVAGAQGFVSRVYQNKTTGQSVDVWLIVGHARDTAEHTPDSCYPSSGFEQKDRNAIFEIEAPDQPVGKFWTAIFQKDTGLGVAASRVYWAWFKPTLGDDAKGAPEGVEWIAPKNSRLYFGSTRALYKLYLTAQVSDVDEEPDESVCLEFADEFLPVVNEILSAANSPIPTDFVPPDADDEAA